MLFNSYQFIFIFLPITFGIYFSLNYFKKTIMATAFLALASVFFYAFGEYKHLWILLLSISFNYFISGLIYRARFLEKQNFIESKDSKGNIESANANLDASPFASQKILSHDEINLSKKPLVLLIIALVFNITLLCYFKYMDFFIESFNALFHTNLPLLKIILPLGISFFTITQIAYIVDCYLGRAVERNIINYALFVTFFPHLIAGPILHHAEMMPQFSLLKNKILRYDNIAKGLFIFSIGLFKKVFIADSFAKWANAGYSALDSGITLNIFEAWATSLSYTFQLYFDFSGYCDMAIGLGLLFNIALPINFASPYKSLNIAEFWRRWHITLGRFLRDYIYIPLGGNRNIKTDSIESTKANTDSKSLLNKILTLRNLFIVAFISGVWHGAGLGFVIWGILHGLAMCLHRIYRYFIESKFNYKFKNAKILSDYLGNTESKTQNKDASPFASQKAQHDELNLQNLDSKGNAKNKDTSQTLSMTTNLDSKGNTQNKDASPFASQKAQHDGIFLSNIESKNQKTSKNHNFISFIESRFYNILCWFITFNFINITWIFFRATNLDSAINLIKSMFYITQVEIISKWYKKGEIFANTADFRSMIYFMIFAIFLVFICKNSISLLRNFNPLKNTLHFFAYLAFVWVLFGYSLYKMLFFEYSEFIYFNF